MHTTMFIFTFITVNLFDHYGLSLYYCLLVSYLAAMCSVSRETDRIVELSHAAGTQPRDLIVVVNCERSC